MKESYTAHPDLLSAFHLLHLSIIRKHIGLFMGLEFENSKFSSLVEMVLLSVF